MAIVGAIGAAIGGALGFAGTTATVVGSLAIAGGVASIFSKKVRRIFLPVVGGLAAGAVIGHVWNAATASSTSVNVATASGSTVRVPLAAQGAANTAQVMTTSGELATVSTKAISGAKMVMVKDAAGAMVSVPQVAATASVSAPSVLSASTLALTGAAQGFQMALQMEAQRKMLESQKRQAEAAHVDTSQVQKEIDVFNQRIEEQRKAAEKAKAIEDMKRRRLMNLGSHREKLSFSNSLLYGRQNQGNRQSLEASLLGGYEG